MPMDQDRINRITQSMETEGWAALICRLPENVLFLSGWWPLTGTTWILFAGDGRHRLIIPACEAQEAQTAGVTDFRTYQWAHLKAPHPEKEILMALRDLAGSFGIKTGRVGIEESFESIAPPLLIASPSVPTRATRSLVQKALPQARLEDAASFIHRLRVRKTKAEIEKLRIANEIAAFGLAAFRDNVAEGISEIELASLVNSAIAVKGSGYQGVRSALGFAQVASGPATERAWRPCEITTHRKLLKGDIALLELGVIADGFWADNTRARVVGRPNHQQQKIYDLVCQAQQNAIACMKPGVKMSAVDQAAREPIEAAGYGEYFVHITGHGIGWNYHEFPPLLHPQQQTPLEEGMVSSVEPGLYIPGFGGIRVEDIVAVGPAGPDVLSTYPRDLHE